MTPEDVAELLNREPDSQDDAPQEDVEFQRRPELLEPVVKACKGLWAEKSPNLVPLAEQLGTGSRNVSWRLAYGKSGILDLFLEVLNNDSSSQQLKVQALRIAGNSCADTDENRAKLVEDNRLSYISKHLQDRNLLQFVIPVLYNSMVDYEPVQKLASESKLSHSLLQLLKSTDIDEFMPVVPYIVKILTLMAAQEGEAAIADEDIVDILLDLTTTGLLKDDVEDVVAATAVAVAYLGNERFQSRFAADPHTSLFLRSFEQIFALNPSDVDDEESSTQLKTLYPALLNALADISSTDAFVSGHQLSSYVSQTFLTWLKKSTPDLQAAACLALGNLCRSDEASISLVDKYKAHESLFAILNEPKKHDAQLLHASLSFSKNLAIPAENKLLLSKFLQPSCLLEIYKMDTMPHVQFAAMSLTRLLLLNCPSNVKLMCTKQADGEDGIKQAITLFSKADAEPTKLEGARAVAATCRALHSSPVKDILADDGTGDDTALRAAFYKEHDVTTPLSFLITQSKWPILRSETWFVLALISRSPDGAQVIASLLQEANTMESLSSTITGQKSTESDSAEATGLEQLQLEPQQVSPSTKADTSSIDRENALVLCTELLKNWTEEFAGKKEVLEDLLKEGTRIHLQK